MSSKVLISDKLDPLAVQIFEKKGIDVDFKPGIEPTDLSNIIENYDGLAVRSATTVTSELLTKAKNLKVIGRAGIGVDNIDLKAATDKGIIVMNTPFGNSITAAEHAIAMMFALARQIPQANESTHQGKWEKKKFMGTELFGKTLGVIGCGNIGSIVSDRALGIKMHVLAFDPFLTQERAIELGVDKLELDAVLERADFITLHVPKNKHTAGIINKESINKMKDGVKIINCARGGLIVESDLLKALENGKVAGAALDVFEEEPAKDNPLFGHPNIVCTPHLGAATSEAQVKVAIQIAEQMADYLNAGAVTNALNMPSISAEEAPRLKPYMKLAEQLGNLAGQIIDEAIENITIEYQGTVADLNVKPLTAILVANLLQYQLQSINMVNAMSAAQARGIKTSETVSGSSQDWRSVINLSVTSNAQTRTWSGTLFTGKEPRIVNIEGVPIEAALSKHMLYIRNNDQPGLVGKVGEILGNANLNIADFRLGRIEGQQKAICIVALDEPVDDDIFTEIAGLSQIESIKRLGF